MIGLPESEAEAKKRDDGRELNAFFRAIGFKTDRGVMRIMNPNKPGAEQLLETYSKNQNGIKVKLKDLIAQNGKVFGARGIGYQGRDGARTWLGNGLMDAGENEILGVTKDTTIVKGNNGDIALADAQKE